MDYLDSILFNHHGFLPPVNIESPVDDKRSPYKVELSKFVALFSIACSEYQSKHRIRLLRGFLEYRAELHKIGIVDGFHWVNGSFVTYKEKIVKQPPSDIDVFTLFRLPEGESQQSLEKRNSELFDHDKSLALYGIDSYHLCIDVNTSLYNIIDQTNYWYGMWSHQKNTHVWKGFIQIDLSPQEDKEALACINDIERRSQYEQA